jgi:hypothetical protein
MDPLQVGIIAIVGGVASHLMAKRKFAQKRREWMHRHIMSMTALADAAVEVMAVDYNADLKECMEKLYAKALEKNPALVGLSNPNPQPGAYEQIDKLRKEKHGDKKPS